MTEPFYFRARDQSGQWVTLNLNLTAEDTLGLARALLAGTGYSAVPTEATRSVVSAVRHHTVKHRSALRADVIRHTDPGAPDCLRCVVEAALDSDQNEEG